MALGFIGSVAKMSGVAAGVVARSFEQNEVVGTTRISGGIDKSHAAAVGENAHNFVTISNNLVHGADSGIKDYSAGIWNFMASLPARMMTSPSLRVRRWPSSSSSLLSWVPVLEIT